MENSVFIKACRREEVGHTPIWLMRQAGRYMPEYRAVRSRFSFLDLCKNPDAAAEVTVRAVERLGVDAAIIFADILLIVEPFQVGLEFSDGSGPVINNTVRSAQDVEKLPNAEAAAELVFVYEAIKQAKAALSVPLIGFSGAPFTLASYLIEGGGSRNYLHTKRLMYHEPEAWHALMRKLTVAIIDYAQRQMEAGADAIQIFDSWVGCLAPGDYQRFVAPHMSSLFSGIQGRVPVIHFATGSTGLLKTMKECGGDVIGVDWRIDLATTWQRLGDDVAIQGNLDPVALMAPLDEIRARTKEILDSVAKKRGHIFNLGHGILPETPVDNAIALVDMVHEMSSR